MPYHESSLPVRSSTTSSCSSPRYISHIYPLMPRRSHSTGSGGDNQLIHDALPPSIDHIILPRIRSFERLLLHHRIWQPVGSCCGWIGSIEPARQLQFPHGPHRGLPRLMHGPRRITGFGGGGEFDLVEGSCTGGARGWVCGEDAGHAVCGCQCWSGG